MSRRGLVTLAVLASSAAAHAEVECWAPLREEDSASRPAFRALRRATLEAERIVRGNAAFLAAPEAVRGRPTISAGPTLPDARLHVTAYPEKSAVGIPVWTGKCEVIPQADRIAAGAGQVSIFFDHGIEGSFLGGHARPELTGRHGGYPEYNGWIVITRRGRLPWIPRTLDDALRELAERRERALADWRKSKAGRKLPDDATVEKTAAMLRERDPAGAEKYRAAMRELAADLARAASRDGRADAHHEGQLAAVSRARASFTAAQLRQPVVWRDASGEGKRRLEAQIRALRAVPAGTGRAARRAHDEEVALDIEALLAAYDLDNLGPGDERDAMGFKVDPTFPDPADPAIQVITVYIGTGDTRHGRDGWMKKTKETLDYAALAALLR